MEVINTWLGIPPTGYEAYGYTINAIFVITIISEVISLFKTLATQSLRIGR